jgi:hypothetical protein
VNESLDHGPNPAADSFYAGALSRIRRFMIGLGAGLTGIAALHFGVIIALGFAVGCVVAYLNFHWLKRAVSGLADRVSASPKKQSSGRIVLSFLVRYLLMAVAAYAIFKISPASLYGLLAGLFLPVSAILCEAAYETFVALRRGF